MLTPTSSPDDAQRRRAAIGRLLRLGVSDNAKSSSSDAATTNELEAELSLLREENARLKVERHRPADVGHVIERMRSIRQGAPSVESDEESVEHAAAAQVIVECVAMRESLMDACEEVQRAMQGIRGRLEALAGDIQGRGDDRQKPEQRDVPAVDAMNTEPEGVDEDSPALARSVA